MSRLFLPAWSSLLVVGWLLGHYWNQLIDWLGDKLDKPRERPPVAEPASNVRVLPLIIDFERWEP